MNSTRTVVANLVAGARKSLRCGVAAAIGCAVGGLLGEPLLGLTRSRGRGTATVLLIDTSVSMAGDSLEEPPGGERLRTTAAIRLQAARTGVICEFYSSQGTAHGRPRADRRRLPIARGKGTHQSLGRSASRDAGPHGRRPRGPSAQSSCSRTDSPMKRRLRSRRRSKPAIRASGSPRSAGGMRRRSRIRSSRSPVTRRSSSPPTPAASARPSRMPRSD